MGKMDGRNPNQLSLSLVGNFRLNNPDGAELRISEKKGRVLLAMLATARDHRRSRDWLKSRIWGRALDEQAGNSLRQSLHALRKAIHPWNDAVQADYEHVWLEGVDVSMDPGDDVRVAFFEDAPALDEGGEDWLREERQAFAARLEDARTTMVDAGPATKIAPVNFEGPPCILIGNPVVISDDPLANVVAERITSAMQTTFMQNGFVETFDLRDLESNQLTGRAADAVSRPPVLVEVRISVLGDELQATILARVPATGKVVWTSSIGTDRASAYAVNSETMMQLVMGAVDSIEAVVLRQRGTASKPTLYTAVHQLFGLSHSGIRDSADILQQFIGSDYSPNAESWLAFSAMLRRNEIRERQCDAVEEAGTHLARALEADPSNAISLAIAGHYEGFLRGDLEQGRRHIADSLRLVPNLAFAWDARAMNAIYSNDCENGAQAADMARSLGRYSPYKYYYDTSAMIAATLQQRYADAIRIGQRVLSIRPSFLPVLRHLFISHAMLDEHEKAQDYFRQIRKLDSSFGTTDMDADDYAQRSADSLAMIKASLLKVGLIDKASTAIGRDKAHGEDAK
ncbi:hypothetical protein [Sulfitobacter sp. JB4-11]|uniref:hypothetical protein n=1 Tax=Sulfitobacter rhodophyticola TaxID=3238304 RepID=UPI00351331AD